MRRLGDLLPAAASTLGLEESLRMGRAMAAWQRLVEERLPAPAATSRLLEMRGGELVVSAPTPIVAQELRLRAAELLDAYAAMPGGLRIRDLRVVVRSPGDGRDDLGRSRGGV